MKMMMELTKKDLNSCPTAKVLADPLYGGPHEVFPVFLRPLQTILVQSRHPKKVGLLFLRKGKNLCYHRTLLHGSNHIDSLKVRQYHLWNHRVLVVNLLTVIVNMMRIKILEVT